MFKKLILKLSFLILTATFSATSQAETANQFPSAPIKIIIQYAPGGGVDFLTRIIADGLHQRWGQPVLVESRPGGGGVIATEAVVKAHADGYTLLLSDNVLTVMPAMRRKLSFDIQKDLAPISLVATSPLLLLVHPSVDVKTVAEFIDYAKKRPNELLYASSGLGSVQHISMELFKSLAGVQLVNVPYKGAAAALLDLSAGRVHSAFGVIGSSLPHVKAGTIRALAVSESQRTSLLPDVPTVSEAGVAGYDTTTWYGLLAPANTPKDILAKINQAVTSVLDEPKAREILAARGIVVHPHSALTKFSSQFFEDRIKSEVMQQVDLAKRGLLNLD